MIRKFQEYFKENQQTPKSKNKILIDSINELNVNNIKDTDIIKMVCDYGLCVEDRDGYGEWNKYQIRSRSEEAMFQTPKQIADAVLELLKYDINTYAEIGVFKGGSHLLIKNMLELKNKNLESVAIDIQDKHMTEDVKKYMNLHIGTSEDFKGQKFDLVFIDGDHSYEGIATDYENLGQYANIVMFHDINDSTCPGVVKYWNEIKEGKKYKEFTYQTNNQPIQGIGIIFNETQEKYPAVRHLSSYESAISILESGFIMSRDELKNHVDELDPSFVKRKGINSNDKWWKERKQLENKKFGSDNIIHCTPDWFNNYGYETGHGPVMIYFKPSIFEDFKVTLTIEDSLTEKSSKHYDNNAIKKIYSNIVKKESNEYKNEAKKILENLNHKNSESTFDTSKGKVFIEGDRFYNKYSEIQIHANKIPIEYIQEIKFTDNYLDTKDTDKENKEKLILIYKEKFNL